MLLASPRRQHLSGARPSEGEGFGLRAAASENTPHSLSASPMDAAASIRVDRRRDRAARVPSSVCARVIASAICTTSGSTAVRSVRRHRRW